MAVTITLRDDDAEPILRQYAKQAAFHSALLDYVTRKTRNVNGRHYGGRYDRRPDNFEDLRKEWQATFARAKRVVESFGVEFDPISETEALGVTFDYVGGKQRKGALGFTIIEGSKPDLKHPIPSWRGAIASEACDHAAERAVRAWRSKSYLQRTA